MRNIRFLIVLLAATLFAPAAVLAAGKMSAHVAEEASFKNTNIIIADSRKSRDQEDDGYGYSDDSDSDDSDSDDDDSDSDDDDMDGDDDDSDSDDDDMDSDDDDSDSDDDDGDHKGKGKYKDKGKSKDKIKKGHKDGKHQARNDMRTEHAERMRNAETAEERKAIADDMKALRKDKGDRMDNMGGKRRDVSLDEQAEKDAVSAARARRDANAERLGNATTPEERQAIMEEMKAAKKGRADDKREMVREHQEGRKEMRIEQRADRAETRAVYAERMEAAETDEEREAIQEEMKTARAEQHAERVEQQKAKKPWWRFWGD